MYNDEKNLYDYTYRKDGSELPYSRESVRPDPRAAAQGPIQEMKPVKKKRRGMKIAALALACARCTPL